MPLYEKKWWKRLFKKESEPKENSLKDISTMIEFLEDVKDEAQLLIIPLKRLEELEKERRVGSKSLTPINLQTQAKLLDSLLEKYEFFQNDVDISGIRMKRVAKEFLYQAKKAGLKDLVKEKQKSAKWKFNW